MAATVDSVGLLQPRDDHKSVQELASRRSSVQMIRRPFHELWRPVCQLPGKSHICKIVEEIMHPPFPKAEDADPVAATATTATGISRLPEKIPPCQSLGLFAVNCQRLRLVHHLGILLRSCLEGVGIFNALS